MARVLPWFMSSSSPLISTPRVGPELHAYRILEFFFLRGAFFGRGIVEHAPQDRPTLVLRLWDGRLHSLDYELDPIHQSGVGRTCFTFATLLPRSSTAEERASMKMYIVFKDDHLLIEDPSAQIIHGNPFLEVESDFWRIAAEAGSGARALEIGSRARSGFVRRDKFAPSTHYTGFDICSGVNVDQVGDAHELSRYFPLNSFDLALSITVWEHLAMPWKASVELNRVLKLGAHALICTNQTWPVHEQPWDFFRFSADSWPSLFNKDTGFEIIKCGVGFPAVIVSAACVPYLENQMIDWHHGYLASACLVRKVSETSLDWPVPMGSFLHGLYPF